MAIPTWLTVISWIFISIGLLSAALVLADIYLAGYREHVKIMEAVWPLTALTYTVTGRPGLLIVPGGQYQVMISTASRPARTAGSASASRRDSSSDPVR